MVRTLGIFVGLLIFAYALFFVVLLVYKISVGRGIGLRSSAFTSNPKDANLQVLVIGDSTGVGTGSASPKLSVAGRLSEHLGSAALLNTSRNGAKMEVLLEQLERFPPERTFDLILIQAGGNDILQFTPLTKLREDTQSVLQKAEARGKNVIFMSTGDVGTAPLFLPPLSLLYDRRTRVVREIFIEIAKQEGVTYVDLFKEPKDEPFTKDPKRFYAADGLHPSADGYGLWFEELKAKLPAL